MLWTYKSSLWIGNVVYQICHFMFESLILRLLIQHQCDMEMNCISSLTMYNVRQSITALSSRRDKGPLCKSQMWMLAVDSWRFIIHKQIQSVSEGGTLKLCVICTASNTTTWRSHKICFLSKTSREISSFPFLHIVRWEHVFRFNRKVSSLLALNAAQSKGNGIHLQKSLKRNY